MLDGNDSVLMHRAQNAALLVLSIAFLPFDTFILLISYGLKYMVYNAGEERRQRALQKPGFKPYRVLVTGVGMTKGLCLARQFYEAGHWVMGADFEPYHEILVCGRMSASLHRFVPLCRPDAKNGPAPYIQSVLHAIGENKVDLWVSCSGVASAVEDGMAMEVVQARTPCKAIQFDAATTRTLHEKHSFIRHTEALGLVTPETHEVTSGADVEAFLSKAPPSRKYIMKTIGVDDAMRADLTLLPRDTVEDTARHIARLRISKTTPWILQQFVNGCEYCTHSLVVGGKVRAFVACRSAELLMHYEALPPTSPLSRAMLDFTEKFAAGGGKEFTGHLSFDFLVENPTGSTPADIPLYPIECNPRAHTAVALFNGTHAMVDAYLSALDASCEPPPTIVVPVRLDRYYWIGHDVVTLVILPTLSALTLSLTLSELTNGYKLLLTHLAFWKDGTYEAWDPLPWWWLYHGYWTMQFWNCMIKGTMWSRLNVSTTKMFEC